MVFASSGSWPNRPKLGRVFPRHNVEIIPFAQGRGINRFERGLVDVFWCATCIEMKVWLPALSGMVTPVLVAASALNLSVRSLLWLPRILVAREIAS
jgi:hypothetical protein